MNKIIFLIVTIFLTGCTTTLKYTMNNSKFLTPETKGKFLSGDAGLSYQITNKVVLESAFDPIIFNSPIVLDLNYISSGTNLSLPINLGLLERLDYYNLDFKNGLKFQFWGDPQIKKTEGYKAAIALAYGYDQPDSENIIYTDSSSRTYNTTLKIKSYETSLLFGKRTSEKQLIYTNLFYDYYFYDGYLKSSQFNDIHAKGHSFNTGLLVGIELSNIDKPSLIVKFESGVVCGRLNNTDTKTAGSLGGSIAIGW